MQRRALLDRRLHHHYVVHGLIRDRQHHRPHATSNTMRAP
jgi:hypothetical protein